MNPNLNKLPYKYIYVLGVAVLVLLGTVFLNRWTHRNINLSYFAPQLNAELRNIETQAEAAMADKTVLRSFLLNNYTEEEMTEWANKPFSLLLYKNDSLAFWSNNKILPHPTEIGLPSERSYTFFQLDNGKYEQIKDKIRIDTSNYTIISLIPISYEYAYENEYLHNNIALPGDYPSNLQLSAVSTTDKEATVNNKTGNLHFSLVEAGRKAPPSLRNLVLFGYFLSFLLLAIALNGFAAFISNEYGDWIGVIGLGSMILLVRNISNFWGISSEFKDIALFNPDKFTYSLLTTSLGDLLINVSLLTWLVFFFYHRVETLPLKKISEIGKLVLVTMFYFFILSGIYTVDSLFNAVVLRSNITLDINDVFTLDQYSFWSLSAILLLMASLFAFSHKLSLFIKQLNVPQRIRLVFLGLSTLTFTILNFANALNYRILLILTIGIVFVVLLDFYVKDNKLSSSWLALWLVVFAGFASYELYDYNNTKDLLIRRKLGTQLVQDRDSKAEQKIIDLQKIVLSDTSLYTKIIDPNVSHIAIEEYVEREYLTDNYLSQKYTLETHVYDAIGDTIKGEKSLMAGAINSRIDNTKESVRIGSHNFFWHPTTSISAYISKYPVYKGRMIKGFLVLELVPRNERSSAVFSDLLTSTAVKEASLESNYDYAIYDDKDLKLQKGKNYDEKLNIDNLPEINQEILRQDGDRSTLVMRKTKNLVVLVSKSNDTFVRPFSLFSYLFFIISLMLSLALFIYQIYKGIIEGNWLALRSMALHSRIQYFVIGTIMASFVVVAAISIVYIRNNYADYLGERLIEKTKESVAHDFEMETDSLVIPDVNHLANEHNTDFHIFDIHGNLLKTSVAGFYDRGISARQMPYNVIRQLGARREVLIAENFGGFRVKTAYVPIKKHDGGKNLAFVGIPYTPGTDKALRKDIAGFVQTLLNTYVMLLIAAGMLTIFIANSVTLPLKAIGERLQNIKLGAKNEPIQWEGDDEIGVLVAEYNKMIAELEQSTTILAQSEREGAWKEMARQVAHEIKNPLTPMKLNIQLLERAFNSDPERGKLMFNRVSQILIQQIDNLSNIATEFSNFSKMPRANNETFLVNTVVENCFKLFRESENTNIEWSMATAPEEFFVNTDKNQLIQVLNNLLKNAEQAMPDYRKGEINLILYQREKYVVIQVSDNGCGIPLAKRDKIFTPNFTTKGSGSGLGLAISRRIIETAGGSIAFESEEDKGTDFFIELPTVLAFA